MSERKKILLTILVATLAFALLLAAAFSASAAIKRERLRRIETALERGDTLRAERLLARVDDDETRAALEARCRYCEAAALLESGDYREAAAAFAALGGYEDASEKYREALYRLAERELSEGDFDAAQRRFEALGVYRDAAARAQEAQLQKAAALAAEGQIYEAFMLLEKLGDFSDARERALALAEQICGKRDLDAARAVAQNLSAEELQRRVALRARREAIPEGIVDAGFYHTVALRSDGTVLACGDNSFGQCEVDTWRNVTALCAGAYHTAALLSDGTVIACGRNTEGQCEVASWRDIVAITAADYATFGLRVDGSIVCCGYNDYYMLADWPKVTRISGGSYALAALRADGEALLTHASARSEDLTELVDIAVNTGYAVGLKEDGSVVCAAAELSSWRDIVAVSASSNAILGLDAQGAVRAYFFRPDKAFSLDGLDGIVALAAGGTHSVFVLADGTVAARGENAHGECDTADWKLF